MAVPTDLIFVAYSPSERKFYNDITVSQVANVAAVATADATSEATSYALGNALKVKVNAILTALKAAGVMIADS